VAITVGALSDGFFVEDDGQGVPDSEKEAVLEAGYTTATDGTGYGLYIVTEIAAAHGWEIEVADGRDGGARFGITDVETP
jgi:signal transduction histidine kinase